MRESIETYFQIGTIQWMSYPGVPVEEAVHCIACDDFFTVIELGRMPDAGTAARVKQMTQTAHLKVCYGAQPRLLGPGLNPNSLKEEHRLEAEKTLLEAIDEAEFLGADTVAFLAGQWEDETKETAYRQLLKTTRVLCDYAAAKGMGIELEVFDFDMDKASLIGPAPYAAKFAADMRTTHHNFGLLVDLSHIPTTYETSRFVIQTLRPYITHFHIGNAVVKKGAEAYGDQHPRFGFPDSANDTAELADFFTVLKEEGFFRAPSPYVLSIEVKPWQNEEPAIILANTKRVIKRAWAMTKE
jgi:Sugar phosphate isomerases/epimerases